MAAHKFMAVLLVLLLVLAVRAEQELPDDSASAVSEGAVVTPPAAEAVTEAAIEVSLDELTAMLEEAKTPRVSLRTRHTTLTGRALRVERGQVFLDVTGERLAVSGVLGTPVTSVRSVEVLVALSQEELRQVEEASALYLRRIRERAAELAEAEPEAEAPAGVGPEIAEPGPTSAAALLEKYPPGEGWGPERVFEITRKRIVLGANPFGKERTFLEDYQEWTRAYNVVRAEQLELLAGWEEAGVDPPEDFELWSELGPVPSLEGEPWQEFDYDPGEVYLDAVEVLQLPEFAEPLEE